MDNVVQLTTNIGKSGGRERVIRTVSNVLGTEVYSLSKFSNHVDGLQPSPEALEAVVNEARDLDREYEFLEGVDTVVTHDLITPFIIGDSYQVICMNHGGFKQYSYLYDSMYSNCDETKQFFLDENIEDIRNVCKKVLEKPDVLVSDSKHMKNALKNYYGVDSKVVYSPVGISRFEYGYSEKNYFLSVQRLEWIKRIEKQLEVFASLDEELHIVGEGTYSDLVEKYSRKHDNIVYKGYMGDKELKREYSQAKALVHTGMPEDCPTVIKEALACGTPVIAPDLGANPELLPDRCGLLYEPGNFGRAIKSFDRTNYDEEDLTGSVSSFSLEKFEQDLKQIL